MARESRRPASLNHAAGPGPEREESARSRQAGRAPNAAWQSLATGGAVLQARLTVSRPGDPFEEEADRVADQVMRMPAPAIQRKCAACEEEEQVQVQRRASPSPDGAGVATTSVPDPGAGRPLDPAIRADMEPRFGYDFGQVRVHTGGQAAASARSVNAIAYTLGRDVVFGGPEYPPRGADDRRLLAHELTHVVQQGSASGPGMAVQRKANAIRFQEEPTLDEISDGKKVLKEKDKGEAVIRVTTALHELGHYIIDIIDENFDPPLTSAVTKYQTAKGLTGKALAGAVDQATFVELDKDFSGSYKVERDVIGKQPAADVTKNTQSIDDVERAAIAKAISTEPPVNPVTGLPPTFVPEIVGKGKYKNRLRTMVDAEIVSQYNAMGKNKAAQHADPTKLYDWTMVEGIANESKNATDKVFGAYLLGPAPPLKKGVNIGDAWDDKVAQLTAGGTAAEDAAADWRVEKILTGDDNVKALDREHGAIQTRPAEAAIVAPIKSAMIAKYRTELIETHKGWPGYAARGKIFIQIFKGATANRRKFDMWDLFQTFIHEYIHTLEHTDYRTFRGGLAQQKGGFTLREGTTDYFTKIVWNGIVVDAALRKTIEGPFHDPLTPFPVQALGTYGESENAERLAGIVGIRNLAAAFFRGKVELIGKK